MTLLIHASQLLTIPGGPQRGSHLGYLGVIEDGAILFRDEKIIAVGTTSKLLSQFPSESIIDAGGRVVMPGFVDPHTHLVWAGDRAVEFEMRLQGKSYMEIMAAGGGIHSTVMSTRQASFEELCRQTHERALAMFQHGTTTAEVKTGYGLSLGAELAQMKVILELDRLGPMQLVPTFLGAHAIAPEYKNDPQRYADLVANQMLPGLKTWWKEHAGKRPLPFVDVFCEKGVFDIQQTREILSRAKKLGFPLKIHVDEFENLGGATLAAELGAVSADHLVKTSETDIRQLAESGTIAVSLPCTPFGLADSHFTPAQDIIANDGILAIATDCNPGTAWCENMQFVVALACRYLKLTPAQAICAATINAAAAIQMDSILGSVEPDKQADFIILSVDDYLHLGYRFGTNLVKHIIKKGQVFTNTTWN